MGSITTPSPRPGLMICTPSLHHPSPQNYDLFLRWTKLHFRDLVDIPAIPGGKITRALQFVTPGAVGREGEYFNVIQASHHPIWSSEGYKSNCKRLDLENARALYPGEVPVGCKEDTMVFDVCNATFSIYELVGEDGYHAHPRAQTGEKKVLVAVNFAGEDGAREVLEGVVQGVSKGGRRAYASLYKHMGDGAQPAMHPRIESGDVGGGEWLGLVAVIGGEGVEIEGIRKSVEERVGKEDGCKVGIWEEVVDVGERESE